MISIVIPLYNKEKYVRDTLRSLKNIPDIEVLVIDNNSTDRSPEICREEQATDPSLRILVQPRQGVSAARNLGIEEARGEYICFLDADDRYREFEQLQSAIKEDSPDIIAFGFEKFDNETQNIISRHELGEEHAGVTEDRAGSWIRECVEKHIAYNVSNKVYRTEFLRETGLRFDEDMDRLEDLSFFIRAFGKSTSTVYCAGPYHQYRVNLREGSLGRKKRENYDFLFRMISYYRETEKELEGRCPEGQMKKTEEALYLILNRELSTMRMDSSLAINRLYASGVRKLLRESDRPVNSQHDPKKKSRSSEYLKLQLAVHCPILLCFFTRIKWLIWKRK